MLGALFSIAGGLASAFGSSSSDSAAASAYEKTAKFAKQNVKLTQEKTGIDLLRQNRRAYQILGGARADAASNGLKASGSVLDLIRSSAAEAALDSALIQKTGAIEETNWRMKAAEAKAAAKGAKASSSGGLLGGVLGAAGSLFGL